MKVMFRRPEVLEKVKLAQVIEQYEATHNGHLAPFARRIFLIAKTLSHYLVDREASP
jgi:hypothetical protein